MASIKDVAKAAGVSVSTVSRTINDNPFISSATREKVLKAIKELNYSPNRMAQSLSNNNSYTITLIVDIENEKSFYNSFFYEVMHGIEKVVYQKEYCLIVSNLNTVLKNENVLDWLIKGKRTEGVILPSSIIDSKTIKKLKENNIPFVSIGEPENLRETINWVDINNRKAGEQAANYFIDNHRRKIAFIGYDDSKVFNRRRFEGYKLALENNELNYETNLVIKGGNSKNDGFRMMKDLLNEKDLPDSVICADNLMSIGAIRAIQESGLSIPEDISLISFDNSQIAEIMYPTISTINVDVYELGLQSAKLLFELIENPGKREQELLISTNIEERETTEQEHQ
ncbi:LacI family DNA-binding transcriptional regulator [Mesobacillus stamsii]|uniref:DNA-binding LacI/PurR family transcriptional regulator n=1 Tax=Mesobacillus stamsii TaxID=225347 RepID=A0ABU0FZW0_9BACI|nr:LacI family DNA-binding transcriptional regulator [Mesobacillus stamsii]MDQ0415473.1 DNA-binding LacI/PurR family transcriptional regulator [Mesobacillus stamsii]